MGLMNEYINKGLGAPELEAELLRLIGEYNKLRKTNLLVYAAAMGKPIPDISLNADKIAIKMKLQVIIKSILGFI